MAIGFLGTSSHRCLSSAVFAASASPPDVTFPGHDECFCSICGWFGLHSEIDLVTSRGNLARHDRHMYLVEIAGNMTDTIDLSGDGGVLKTIVRSAKADAIAPSEELPLVDVHYEGVLAENGEVFDTTKEDNTVFSFEIGKGSVIKAWEIGVKTMKVGEIAKFTCKAEYAYGSAGSPPDIPPDATLIFEVELVACMPRKGLSLGGAADERARLEDLRKQRELAAATKEEEKKKREEAKAAAAARIQAKMGAKKGQGKGKGKAK